MLQEVMVGIRTNDKKRSPAPLWLLLTHHHLLFVMLNTLPKKFETVVFQ